MALRIERGNKQKVPWPLRGNKQKVPWPLTVGNELPEEKKICRTKRDARRGIAVCLLEQLAESKARMHSRKQKYKLLSSPDYILVTIMCRVVKPTEKGEFTLGLLVR